MKNVLITGAGRGVGLALTENFLRNGHTVFAASRNLRRLEDLVQAYPGRCIPVFLDISSIQAFDALEAALKDMAVKLDIVFHNAGYLVKKPFEGITRAELLACYEVNVLGPYSLTQFLLPFLGEDAHNIYISSMGGFQGSQKFPGLTAYSSSKAAVAGLTECLQEEYKQSGWSFNCICLGAVQTEMLEEAFPGYRAPLSPEDLSDYLYTFGMTAHGYMRGKIIPLSLSTP
jgi:NAD(P)-dependent dehydrogenase (short-subunit alcohol dehydrogenase family)